MSISNLSQSENKSAVLKEIFTRFGVGACCCVISLTVGHYLITELFALTDYNIIVIDICRKFDIYYY